MEAVKSAYGDYGFVALYGFCLAMGLVLLQGKGKQFAISACLITVVVFTPFFYRLWADLNEANVYWRALWMLPIIPICAMAVALVVEKAHRTWLRIAVVILGVSAFILCGGYVYTKAYPPRAFSATQRPEKLPEDVVDVGEVLLELEDYPRVVADSSLSVYLRQYSGRIQMPYARSVIYGEPNALASTVFDELTSEDYPALVQTIVNHDYGLLATDNATEEKRMALECAGFEILRQVNGYGIYRAHCDKTELRAYDDLGRVISVTQVDESGAAVNGSNGVAVVLYEYDDNGYVCCEFHRDANGDAVLDGSGKAGWRRELNYLGQVVRETNLDGSEKPVEAGFATRTCEYDRNHRIVRESYFDENGQAMLRTDGLYAARTFGYDGDGKTVSTERFFGLSGEPVLNSSGFASYTRDVDRDGRILRECYWDTDGKAIMRSSGYAEVRRGYDEQNRVIHESYWDTSGAQVVLSGGYSAWQREYDGLGDIIMEQYLNPDGDEAVLPAGYSRVDRQFDDEKRVLREAYSAHGEAVCIPNGYAAFTRAYDDRGNVIREAHQDASGSPVLRTSGYAAVEREYDRENRVVRERYLDTADAPIMLSAGYSAITREYNGLGRVVKEAYWDGNGQPVRLEAGYAALTREYNALGQIIEEAYQDEEGHPIARSEGYASVKRGYDDRGLVIRESYYDPQGQPAAVAGGYDAVTREYNAQRLLVREVYEAGGAPVLRTDTGIAGFAREYDAQNRLVAERYFGTEQEPVNRSGSYAEYRNAYTDAGALSLSYYYDVDGNLLQRGSAYLHECLRRWAEEDVTVFIAVKDEASGAITTTLADDLKALGIQSDLRGKYRYSFCAVVGKGTTNGQEALDAAPVQLEGMVDGKPYSLSSAGFTVGNTSSIIIDGVEYSKNVRGLNIAIYKDGEVVEAVGFDTCVQDIGVTR